MSKERKLGNASRSREGMHIVQVERMVALRDEEGVEWDAIAERFGRSKAVCEREYWWWHKSKRKGKLR